MKKVCFSFASAVILLAALGIGGCRFSSEGDMAGSGKTAEKQSQTYAANSALSFTQVDIPKLLRKEIAKAHTKSLIPVLLPDNLELPKDPHYVSSSAKRNHYEVRLYSESHCRVRTCTAAIFTANWEPRLAPLNQKAQLPIKNGTDEISNVRLAHDIEGIFKLKTCGGTCSVPSIHWIGSDPSSPYYSVQLPRAEAAKNPGSEVEERGDYQRTKRALVRVANSAILAGDRSQD